MAEQQIVELRALLAARDEALAALQLATAQAQLAERDAKLAADRAASTAHVELLHNSLRLHARRLKLDDVLGIVAAAGFKTEVVPHAALNKGMWRGDALLIGALRNFPRAKDGATRLHFASMMGWVERLTQLVVEDKADVEAADKKGETPLHWASYRGQLEAAQELVRRGAKADAKSNRGDTPLILACYFGHAEVARFLLDKGAAIEAKDEGGHTSLYFASLEDHTEVVKLLLARGAVVDAPTSEGATPLNIASSNGHALIVRELLAHGANPNAHWQGGWAPLHAAAVQGHADALRELLRMPETDVNARSDDATTPLMRACKHCFPKSATLLIPHEAINLNLLDDAGRSARFYAMSEMAGSKSARTIVALLEGHGATT